MATLALRSPALPALSEHRGLRFVTIFLLYVAQGLPIGFFQFALPGWMAAKGASAADIGLVLSASLLPWSLKLINGFVMDRYAFLPMGRRRAWLIGAQLLIVSGLAAMALAHPEPGDVMILAAFALMINIATTFQDVAVDGMAVDLIPDEERGRANGFMFGGQALGMGIGTLVGGFAMLTYGIGPAALMTAAIVAVLLSLAIGVRERPGERLLPWSDGEPSSHASDLHVGAWLPIFRNVLVGVLRFPTILFLIAGFSASIGLGIYLGLAPLMATNILGWSEADFSSLSGTANFAGAAVGILVVGVAADRFGARRVCMVIAGLMLATALLMLALSSSWSTAWLFIGFAVIFLILDTSVRVANCAVAMRLCDPKVAASQFALFMAASNLGMSAGSAMLGTLDAIGSYTAMLAGMAVAASVSLGLYAAARVGR